MRGRGRGRGRCLATDESPAQGLVRLLEKHGLEDSLREILAAIEAEPVDEALARIAGEVLGELRIGRTRSLSRVGTPHAFSIRAWRLP